MKNGIIVVVEKNRGFLGRHLKFIHYLYTLLCAYIKIFNYKNYEK